MSALSARRRLTGFRGKGGSSPVAIGMVPREGLGDDSYSLEAFHTLDSIEGIIQGRRKHLEDAIGEQPFDERS